MAAAKKARKSKKPPRRRSRKARAKQPAQPQADVYQNLETKSEEELELALATGDDEGLLRDYFGEQNYQELHALARQAAARSTRGGARVLLLPGIMGSKLGFERPSFIPDDTIWVDFIDIAAGKLAKLKYTGRPDKVKALGVILLSYLKLKLSLKAQGFDASFYPFDWRKSLDDLGAQLLARINRESAEKVHLVCHSMGGLVARAAAKTGSAKIGRIIQLGTPNHGSYSPVEAFRGTHSLARKMAFIDTAHTVEDLAVMLFTKFPGLCQMLPFPEKFPDIDYYQKPSWPANGPSPGAALLSASRHVHQKLHPGGENFTLIAGINQDTIINAELNGDEFTYIRSRDGDGTVPLNSALLENVATYYVEESHGSLPNNSQVAAAVADILATGQTSLLPDSWQRSRATTRISESDLRDQPAYHGDEGRHLSQQERREFLSEFAAPDASIPVDAPGPRTDAGPASPAPTGLALDGLVIGRRRQHRLNITLAHGSITEVDTKACVVGLFKNIAPGGAARAIDEQLEGAVSELMMRRMFDGRVGEVSMIPAARQSLRSELVAFAGLGLIDNFTSGVLETVGENIARTFIATKVDEFATVLVGANSGISSSEALRCGLQGIFRGIKDADGEHRFRGLTICELNDEKYRQLKADFIQLSSTALFDDFEVTFDEVKLPEPPAAPLRRHGAPRRRDVLYLMANQRRKDAHDKFFVQEIALLTSGAAAAIFKDAKEIKDAELNAHLAQLQTLDATSLAALKKFGQDLAELMLPLDIQKVLKRFHNKPIVVVHDAASSRVPWETLVFDDKAPALAGGMSRRPVAENLSVAKWLGQRQESAALELLLVINPTNDLPGAEAEGERIQEVLASDNSIRIHRINGAEATKERLAREFGAGRYDVIHYAGHAFFDPERRERSGVVCHDEVLSGEDLAGIGNLPSLMFFNACEAARIRTSGVRNYKKRDLIMPSRIDRNVGLAEAIIRGGVANYIGTYWPVGDQPAKDFAEVFYAALIAGKPIGDALKEGREKLHETRSIDWADYIHYGSMDFVLKRQSR